MFGNPPPLPDRTHPAAVPSFGEMHAVAWADAVVALIGCTMAEARIEDVLRGRALIDATPDGLPAPWRDIADLLGTWVRRRETLTRLAGFTLPKAMLDRALADMPQPRHAWQDRKDVG